MTVVSDDSGAKSEPVSTTVTVAEEEDEEIPPVEGLTATYNPANQTINISWQQ